MLKKYLFLTKPGILFGNFVTTLGGFFLAAQGSVDFLLLLITLLGTTLLSCDFNFKSNKCMFCNVIRFLKLFNFSRSELLNLNSLTKQYFVYKNQSINFSRKAKFSDYGGIAEGLPGVI